MDKRVGYITIQALQLWPLLTLLLALILEGK
jgi:hypothetical protein